jgi:hypothetical protein
MGKRWFHEFPLKIVLVAVLGLYLPKRRTTPPERGAAGKSVTARLTESTLPESRWPDITFLETTLFVK